jgi:hypothetical protein
MSLRKLIAGAVAFAAFTPAHDVITTPITFSREISRLLYDRCISCHREGGSAFSLVHYQEARPWAKAIKEEILERRMPPWGAVKGFGDFRNDQGLTQEQIEVIADWVEGGAPEGDPKLLPAVPAKRNEPNSMPAGTAVEGSRMLETAMTLAGIRPGTVPEGATLMVTASKPDGSVEPLLWLYNYKPKFGHPYWFNTPLRLPKGTRIEVSPAQAGSVVLLSARKNANTDEHR